MKPNRDPQSLHPLMRDRVVDLQAALELAGLRFKLYECLRGRERQGDAKGNGSSNAGMWQSFHNYGCAADFVWNENGHWSWDASLPWKELGRLAKAEGLDWGGDFKVRRGGKLVPFFDGPHVQMRGVKLSGRLADPSLLADRLGEWEAWTLRFVELMDTARADDRRIFVTALQVALNFRGAGLVVDGAWGPKTRAAQLEVPGLDRPDALTVDNWAAIARAIKEG